MTMEVTRAMTKHEDGATLNGVALSDLLSDIDKKILAEWWCQLNRWGWPDGAPRTVSRRELMSAIVRRIGKRKCLEEWNNDISRRAGRADND